VPLDERAGRGGGLSVSGRSDVGGDQDRPLASAISLSTFCSLFTATTDLKSLPLVLGERACRCGGGLSVSGRSKNGGDHDRPSIVLEVKDLERERPRRCWRGLH